MTKVSELQKNLIQRVCIGDMVTRAENRFPNKIAIKDGDVTLTYRELNKLVNKCGNALLSLDLEYQDRIALMFPNKWEMLVSYLACAKAGFIAMPISLGLTSEDVLYCLEDSEAKVFIADSKYITSMSDSISKLEDLQYIIWSGIKKEQMPSKDKKSYSFSDFIESNKDEEVEQVVQDRDNVQLLYTSGTTSKPKGVLTSHLAVYITSLSATVEYKLDYEDITLVALPLFHTGTLNARVLPGLVEGGTFILADISDGFDANYIANLIEKEKITRLSLMPMMHHSLLELKDIWERDFSSLKRVTYGMAPMPVSSLKKLEKLYGNTKLTLSSGQTEFTPPTTHQKDEDRFDKAASWGSPISSTHIEIMDEEGNILPRGQIGEIVYRGPQVMTEYLNLPEETKEVFKYGWLHSGDMGWMDEDAVVWFVDRMKDIIKTGGENVASIEIERILLSHTYIQDAAIIGLPHNYWGEAITGFVIIKPNMSITELDLLNYCKERLAGFKVPKKIIFVNEIPKTGSGKIRKIVIRNKNLNLYLQHDTGNGINHS